MTDADEDDTDEFFMDKIARLNRINYADWKTGERLHAGPLGAQVWSTPPTNSSDDVPEQPFATLDANEEIVYLEPLSLLPEPRRWHRVLTRHGVVFVQKYALSEPSTNDKR